MMPLNLVLRQFLNETLTQIVTHALTLAHIIAFSWRCMLGSAGDIWVAADAAYLLLSVFDYKTCV